MDSYILLDGGHRILVYGVEPGELSRGVKDSAALGNHETFIQGTAHGDNGVVVYNDQIAAIVKRSP